MKNAVLTILKEQGVWFFVALAFVSGGIIYAQTKSGGKTFLAVIICLALASFSLNPELILTKIGEIIALILRLLQFG